MSVQRIEADPGPRFRLVVADYRADVPAAVGKGLDQFPGRPVPAAFGGQALPILPLVAVRDVADVFPGFKEGLQIQGQLLDGVPVLGKLNLVVLYPGRL